MVCCAPAQHIRITGVSETHIEWTNSIRDTTFRVEAVEDLSWTNSWLAVTNVFATNGVTSVSVVNSSVTNRFFRVAYDSSLISGLAAYYPLDGSAADLTINENHGSILGVSTTTNRHGMTASAYEFNGTGTSIQVADSASLDMSQLTLSFWFLVRSFPGASILVSKIGPNGQISYGSEIDGGSRRVFFRICTDGTLGTLQDLPCTSALNADQWYHFAGTYDGAQMKLYINGVLNNSTTKTGIIYPSSEALKMGRYGYYGGWYFHGILDDVILWNRALSADEVSQIYSSGHL